MNSLFKRGMDKKIELLLKDAEFRTTCDAMELVLQIRDHAISGYIGRNCVMQLDTSYRVRIHQKYVLGIDLPGRLRSGKHYAYFAWDKSLADVIKREMPRINSNVTRYRKKEGDALGYILKKNRSGKHRITIIDTEVRRHGDPAKKRFDFFAIDADGTPRPGEFKLVGDSRISTMDETQILPYIDIVCDEKRYLHSDMATSMNTILDMKKNCGLLSTECPHIDSSKQVKFLIIFYGTKLVTPEIRTFIERMKRGGLPFSIALMNLGEFDIDPMEIE